VRENPDYVGVVANAFEKLELAQAELLELVLLKDLDGVNLVSS